MGTVESTDLAPVRDDERKELNISRKITYKQYWKHLNGEFHEACLTEIPWNIRDSICLYERMNASFNAISELPPELPLRLPHLNFLDLSHNQLEGLPESFGLLFHLRTVLLKHNKLLTLPQSFVRLVKLEKIDLSNNLLKELPEDFGSMESLLKLNVANNKLKVLPVSLGGCKTLTMLLASGNRLYDPAQSVCEEGSDATLQSLRKKYKSFAPVERQPACNMNEFPRIRGNQLQSSVPNPHSAHVQYIQSQTHTTNTPSRIKTPLLPPLGASHLDADVLRDRIIGLIYGAAIGDAIGLATRGMTSDQALFHYNTENIQLTDIVMDEHRVRWRPGDWTSNFDLFIVVLDSVISWAGVVDELDFAKRLLHFCDKGFPELGDTEGIILSQTIQKVIGEKSFLENPHSTAIKILNHPPQSPTENGVLSDDERSSVSSIGSDNTPSNSTWSSGSRVYSRSSSVTSFSCSCLDLGLDNGAIVRAAVLGVPQFFDLTEVTNNTVRICKATHADGRTISSCVVVAVLTALMLQGKKDLTTSRGMEEVISEARDFGRTFIQGTEDSAEFEYYCNIQDLERLNVTEVGKVGYTMKPLGAALVSLRSKQDFRTAVMKLIMKTGDANSNACVVGALLGCKLGYSNLPHDWLIGLRKKQVSWLNLKINLLLDMLGLP